MSTEGIIYRSVSWEKVPMQTLWKVPTGLVYAYSGPQTLSELRSAFVRARGTPNARFVTHTVYTEQAKAEFYKSINLDSAFSGMGVNAISLPVNCPNPQEVWSQILAWLAMTEDDRTGYMLNRMRLAQVQGVTAPRHPVPEGGYTMLAATDLAPFVFLGGYGGELSQVRDVKASDYVAAILPPSDWRAYTMSSFADRMILEDKLSMWCIDASKQFSPISFMNSIDGYKERVGGKTVDTKVGGAVLINFWFSGIPYIGALTQRPIAKESEILVEYGAAYWYDKFKTAIAPSVEEEEEEAPPPPPMITPLALTPYVANALLLLHKADAVRDIDTAVYAYRKAKTNMTNCIKKMREFGLVRPL